MKTKQVCRGSNYENTDINVRLYNFLLKGDAFITKVKKKNSKEIQLSNHSLNYFYSDFKNVDLI